MGYLKARERTANGAQVDHGPPRRDHWIDIHGQESMAASLPFDANVNGEDGGGHLSTVDLLEPCPLFKALFYPRRTPVPERNCYRATDDLSRGSELLNAFLDRLRWIGPR